MISLSPGKLDRGESELLNFGEDDRNIVGGRAIAPGGNAVEKALFHLG